MNRQMDPELRKQSVLEYLTEIGMKNKLDLNDDAFVDNHKCLAHGMDQGIHNWLFHSGYFSCNILLLCIIKIL